MSVCHKICNLRARNIYLEYHFRVQRFARLSTEGVFVLICRLPLRKIEDTQKVPGNEYDILR